MKSIFFTFSSFFFSLSLFAQPLEINTPIPGIFTAEELLEQIFVAQGIEVISVDFGGDSTAVGEFKHGMQYFGIEEGLVLSTGKSKSEGTGGAFGADGLGTDFATVNLSNDVSDSDIDSLASSSVGDISIYTITFIASSDSVRFRYVFGSEEYPEFSCTNFNDVMGIFISGPGINGPFSNNGENIALIPGTDLPVAINNIHPINLPQCDTSAFENFYHDNDTLDLQPVYDGFLDVFEAEAAIIPGEEYVLKIAIADIGDSAFDSAFFLEAESFGSDSLIIDTEVDLMTAIGESDFTTAIPFEFENNKAHFFPITYAITGTAELGVDYETSTPLTGVINNATELLNFVITPIQDNQTDPFEYIQIKFEAQFVETKTFTLYLLEDGECEIITPNSTICAGDPVQLIATHTSIDSIFYFENSTPLTIAETDSVYFSTIEVSNVPITHLVKMDLLESVCVNISHNWLNDLELWLIAPDGSFLELATDVGNICDNYDNTCFSPTAISELPNIMFGDCNPDGTAPLTGTFLPEGNWKRMYNTPINGNWTLAVIDNALGFTGTLDNWSISFTSSPILDNSVQWSNGQNGASVTIHPTETTTYEATFGNNDCLSSTTITVEGSYQNLNFEICENEFIEVDGVILDVNNPSAVFTYDVGIGCDSIVAVGLSFSPVLETYLVETIFPGQSFQIGNEIYSMAGNYDIVLASSAGCDSIVHLDLSIVNPFDLPDSESIELAACDLLEYCMPVSPNVFNESELFINSLLYENDANLCNNDTQVAIQLPIGTHELILEHDFGYTDISMVTIEKASIILPDSTVHLIIGGTAEFPIYSICEEAIVSAITTCPDQSTGDVSLNFVNNETFTFQGLEAGEDHFCIQFCDELGSCVEQTFVVYVDVTNTTEILNANLFKIHPNPTNQYFQISNAANIPIEQVSIFAPDGRILNVWKTSATNTNYDLKELPQGVYFLKIKTKEGMVVKRLVKS